MTICSSQLGSITFHDSFLFGFFFVFFLQTAFPNRKKISFLKIKRGTYSSQLFYFYFLNCSQRSLIKKFLLRNKQTDWFDRPPPTTFLCLLCVSFFLLQIQEGPVNNSPRRIEHKKKPHIRQHVCVWRGSVLLFFMFIIFLPLKKKK